MKKFINRPEDVIQESLAGFAQAHADLVRLDATHQVVRRIDAPVANKVALISGGGAGHEPLHAGFVGRGMLDAAAVGGIFSSPVPDQVVAAITAVDSGRGTVLLIKNYSGDVMNFRLAAEMAGDEGHEVLSVVLNDDVAVEDSLYTAGRRGTGVTLLVEKIAGARAEKGATLAEVAAMARRVNERGRSFGVALTSCTSPAHGKPTFSIGPQEMEFGVGIHGEPGRRRGPLQPASEIVAEMTEIILDDLKPAAGTPLLAFVNGLGGTPLIELYLVYNELAQQLGQQGFQLARSLVGSYVTSLDMAGISISLLALDDEMLGLWDAPVHTSALRWGG